MRLILASASPQRQRLLSRAGYKFVVHPSNLDETSLEEPGILPADLALKLATAKAAAVGPQFPNDVVLAADTVVALGERCVSKPDDAEHARQMLNWLSGTTHQVITAVVVQCGRDVKSEVVSSTVQMRKLTGAQIDQYIATNMWRGKAGGYGIQDNDPFVQCAMGCMTNIEGLPIKTTAKLLNEVGIKS